MMSCEGPKTLMAKFYVILRLGGKRSSIYKQAVGYC